MSVDAQQVHISSLVVRCLPHRLDQAVAAVKKFKNADVRAHDPVGKFVVLLETENEGQILSIIGRIESIDGVLNASMVYHEID